MADRYVAIHESQARTRRLPGYEGPADWHEDNGWALFEFDDAGTPVRLVFCDRMEPEDAILVRDLRPLVAELNRLASRAPSPPETPSPDADRCDCDGQKGQGCTICSSQGWLCADPKPASPASATSRGTDHDPATKEQS